MDYNPLQPFIDAVLALLAVGAAYVVTYFTVKVRAMRKELVENKAKLDTAEVQRTQTDTKVGEHSTIIAALQETSKALELQNKQLLHELVALQKKYTTTVETELEREKRISELELSLVSTAQQQTALERENQELRNENRELREANIALQKRVDNLSSELGAVKALIQGKFETSEDAK